MNISEQVDLFMDGWCAFIDDVVDGAVRDDVTPTDPVQRGYIASHEAYEAAAKFERERLTLASDECDNPKCVQEGKHRGLVWNNCPDDPWHCTHGPGEIPGGRLSCGAGWSDCPVCHGTRKRTRVAHKGEER